MDRRSWPWRKKSSKNSGAIVVAASANASPSRKNQDHGMMKFYADQVQEANLRYQEAEEKIKALNAKLSAAQAELNEKEGNVKQHAKVAEEAVSGWEKAETETVNTKIELDRIASQNAKLESKVSHLEKAHAEALKNINIAKEDHEKKINELTSLKNKERDRIRGELETRLADVGQRLLEATAENKLLTTTLQDRIRTIAELTDEKSRVESEVTVIRVRLESLQKDNTSLQYEVQVINKQLQIRNEEKEFSRRETEAAQRSQQESNKKIVLLDAEIQRLRTLVRRKLPGPGAVAQMKHEVDAWGREERRRSFGNSPKGANERYSKDFQIQLLTERLLSTEEETKMLREVLAQKNSELQATRSARSIEDGSSCADAWTSVISELDEFTNPKEKPAGILVDDSKFQMMEDFAEMEQLTSNSSAEEEHKKLIAEKDEQINAANRLCMEISTKLLATEKELNELRIKHSEVDEKKLQIRSDLSSNVQKVICLVEALAHAIGVENSEENHELNSPSTSSDISTNSEQSSVNFEKLTVASNKLVEGEEGFTDFMAELSTVLNMMRKYIPENGKHIPDATKYIPDEFNRVKVENTKLTEEVKLLNERCENIQSDLESLRKEYAGRIKDDEDQINGLREKLSTVEESLRVEREQHEELKLKYDQLEKQTQMCFRPSDAAGNNGEDIAQKLADCQKTILALGKQLKVLSSEENISRIPQEHNSRISSENNSRISHLEQSSYSFEDDDDDLMRSPPREVPYGRYGGTDGASWLYSPVHRSAAPYVRPPSPGRFLQKKVTTNELSKSVSLPLTPNTKGSSFGRLFGRNR